MSDSFKEAQKQQKMLGTWDPPSLGFGRLFLLLSPTQCKHQLWALKASKQEFQSSEIDTLKPTKPDFTN